MMMIDAMAHRCCAPFKGQAGRFIGQKAFVFQGLCSLAAGWGGVHRHRGKMTGRRGISISTGSRSFNSGKPANHKPGPDTGKYNKQNSLKHTGILQENIDHSIYPLPLYWLT